MPKKVYENTYNGKYTIQIASGLTTSNRMDYFLLRAEDVEYADGKNLVKAIKDGTLVATENGGHIRYSREKVVPDGSYRIGDSVGGFPQKDDLVMDSDGTLWEVVSVNSEELTYKVGSAPLTTLKAPGIELGNGEPEATLPAERSAMGTGYVDADTGDLWKVVEA